VPPETVVFGVDGMHDVEVRADLVLTHPRGQHGFDVLDDDDRSRESSGGRSP
jgi:hypothetical protein